MRLIGLPVALGLPWPSWVAGWPWPTVSSSPRCRIGAGPEMGSLWKKICFFLSLFCLSLFSFTFPRVIVFFCFHILITHHIRLLTLQPKKIRVLSISLSINLTYGNGIFHSLSFSLCLPVPLSHSLTLSLYLVANAVCLLSSPLISLLNLLFLLSLGVSICLDVVSIESVDLDPGKE